MTSSNKIIKYFAIGLAIFLGISIMYGIISFLYGIVVSIGFFEKDDDNAAYKYYEYTSTLAYIDIDLSYTNLTIEKGNSLSVKTNNNNINISENDNKLNIKENSHNYLHKKNLKELIITIPDNIEYERLIVESGAGEVRISDMEITNLSLNLGAGATNIKNIKVSSADIETGAGNVNISKSNLNNLNLDLGVGGIDIDGIVTGNSKINSGIGAVNLNLDMSSEDYTFKLSKGIGEIKLNGKKILQDETIGTGINYLDIDGGIGEINIKTK